MSFSSIFQQQAPAANMSVAFWYSHPSNGWAAMTQTSIRSANPAYQFPSSGEGHGLIVSDVVVVTTAAAAAAVFVLKELYDKRQAGTNITLTACPLVSCGKIPRTTPRLVFWTGTPHVHVIRGTHLSNLWTFIRPLWVKPDSLWPAHIKLSHLCYCNE